MGKLVSMEISDSVCLRKPMPLNVRKYISLIDHNCLINRTVHMDTRHYTIIRTYIQHVLTDLTCPCTFLWHIHAAVLNRPTPIPLLWFPQ